ncbi:MAG: chorismate synthase [Clostridia bacterium]|nr:chorismate synthase [Clostridia bacterium]
MSSSTGENLKLTIFGQSHSPAIGMTLEGIPAGQRIDFDALSAFLKRRAPGQSALSTPRKEADAPEFLCGILNGYTCGAPITAIIRNTNTRSSDYEAFKNVPRPGHADYTAQVKYNGFQDRSGGGHFSGRLTAPLCIAGGLIIQLLKLEGISVLSRIRSIGDIYDEGELTEDISYKSFPTVSDEAGARMQALILDLKAKGDSVGGVVECILTGVPAGIGDPMFGGLENRISQTVFGIPAVKGIEFGAGFESARLLGSVNNDPFAYEDGRVVTATNNSGGILGGISDGMPIVFKAAFKPTPSIALRQQSVNLSDHTAACLEISGRHDPCIVPRALPCVESAAAIAIYDALLSRRKEA